MYWLLLLMAVSTKAGGRWSVNLSRWWGICYLEVTQSKLFACFCCFKCRLIHHFFQLPDEERKVSSTKLNNFKLILSHFHYRKMVLVLLHTGDCSNTMVKVLCYKSEGRWFDPRGCHWNFCWHNPFDHTMALGSTQPLTEMSTRSITWA